MRQIILFGLVIVMLFVTSASGQFVKDSRRAISLNTCVSVNQLPADVQEVLTNSNLEEYEDLSSLNGMTLTTVQQAGWSTIGVWNERPATSKHGTQFCFTILNPNKMVWVMNGDKNPMFGYLDKCFKAGSPGFKNRLLVPPPEVVIQKQIIEKEKIVTKTVEVPVEKIVTKTVEVPVPGPTVYINPCPIVNGAEWDSKGVGPYLPSWKEWLLGPGKAIAISGIFSKGNRKEAMIYAGTASAADTVLVSALYPDKNSLILDTSAGIMSVRRKKQPFVSADGELILEWISNSQIYLRSKKAGICFSGAVQEGVQFGSDSFIFRDREGKQQVIPIVSPKTQTDTGNVRTGTSGNGRVTIPGNGVPATGPTVPTRPRNPRSGSGFDKGNLVDLAYQPPPSQKTLNDSSNGVAIPSGYRRVTMNGVEYIVPAKQP